VYLYVYEKAQEKEKKSITRDLGFQDLCTSV